MSSHSFTVVLHGGAGTISKGVDSAPYYHALSEILQNTYSYIMNTNEISAVDVAEYTVKQLEDSELFNAGKGAVFAADGSHEMDAAIMNGSDLKCGSVSQIKTIKNPISAARVVMENCVHNFLVGKSAEDLAVKYCLDVVPTSYFWTERRYNQFQEAKARSMIAKDHDLEKVSQDKKGTVGCVVCFNGSLAAATSTGGMTNKLPGRVGDSPVIGAGTYASSNCAVSATGNGEEFIRRVIAFDVHAQMIYGNLSLEQASKSSIDKLPPDCGGLIAVDAKGNYTMQFNSTGMFRGLLTSDGNSKIGIWEEFIDHKCI